MDGGHWRIAAAALAAVLVACAGAPGGSKPSAGSGQPDEVPALVIPAGPHIPEKHIPITQPAAALAQHCGGGQGCCILILVKA